MELEANDEVRHSRGPTRLDAELDAETEPHQSELNRQARLKVDALREGVRAQPDLAVHECEGDIEILQLEAKSKQAEIDHLNNKLDQLINQSKGQESEEVIISLKNQIKDLLEQLALERKESETTYDKQSATIQLLQTELKRQKEITQRIMQKLGMLTTEN